MMEFSELESDEDEPSKPSSKPRRPQDKTQGYPRSECFRVEKNLLVYGSVAYPCFNNNVEHWLIYLLSFLAESWSSVA